MIEKDYALQPLDEIVSTQLSPVGKSRRFRVEKFPLRENIEFYALLPLALYSLGRGLYGLAMNNYEAALRLGDAVQTAMEFFK